MSPRNFFHTLGAIWCAVWAIPVWLIYILPIWLIFKDIRWDGWYAPWIARFKLSLADPTMEPWHVRLWTDWYGIGLPCAIICRDEPGTFDDFYVALVEKHEGRHAYQWFVFGPLFPILYGIGSLYALIKTRDWHHANPFEVDARKASGEEEDV